MRKSDETLNHSWVCYSQFSETPWEVVRKYSRNKDERNREA
ncbi:hypothetical protein JCM10914A_18560 [Paenibacillus sp. JCM 10914]